VNACAWVACIIVRIFSWWFEFLLTWLLRSVLPLIWSRVAPAARVSRPRAESPELQAADDLAWCERYRVPAMRKDSDVSCDRAVQLPSGDGDSTKSTMPQGTSPVAFDLPNAASDIEDMCGGLAATSVAAPVLFDLYAEDQDEVDDSVPPLKPGGSRGGRVQFDLSLKPGGSLGGPAKFDLSGADSDAEDTDAVDGADDNEWTDMQDLWWTWSDGRQRKPGRAPKVHAACRAAARRKVHRDGEWSVVT